MSSKPDSNLFKSLPESAELQEDFKEIFVESLFDENSLQAVYMNLALGEAGETLPNITGNLNVLSDNLIGTDIDLWAVTAAWPTWELSPGDMLTNTRLFSTPAGSEKVIRGVTAKNPLRDDRGSNISVYAAGAVFRVESARNAPGDSVQPGFYLKQVNTYLEWELGENGDGITMDVETGHLLMNSEFFSPRDYFSGMPVNRPEDVTLGSARWYRPFDSPTASKPVRDAIHDAILANHPVNPALNKATQNIHHEYFRQQAVTQARADIREILQADWESDWKQRPGSELTGKELTKFNRAALIRTHEQHREALIARTNRKSQQLADIIAGLRPHQHTEEGTRQLVIWLLANILRREIRLLDLADKGADAATGPDLIYSVSKGYDGTELAAGSRHGGASASEDNFAQTCPPLVIGMVGSNQTNQRGYYAVAPDNDRQKLIWRRLMEDQGGLTVSNLLHAVFATEYAEQQDYILHNDGLCLSATASSRRVVTDWLFLLKHFSSLDYEPFQRALVAHNPGFDPGSNPEAVLIRP